MGLWSATWDRMRNRINFRNVVRNKKRCNIRKVDIGLRNNTYSTNAIQYYRFKVDIWTDDIKNIT